MFKYLTRAVVTAVTALFISGGLSGGAAAQMMVAYSATTADASSAHDFGDAHISGVVSRVPIIANMGDGLTVSISFSGTSALVDGNTGYGWEPVVSGHNMSGNYLAAISGSVTMAMSSGQSTFDFIWGSVDANNSIAFFNGNTQIASFTGAQVLAQTHGNPAYSTARTQVAFAGQTFDRVVATGSQPFELTLLNSSVAAPTPPGISIVPAPAPVPLLGATLFGNFAAAGGFGALWTRKRRRNAKAA